MRRNLARDKGLSIAKSLIEEEGEDFTNKSWSDPAGAAADNWRLETVVYLLSKKRIALLPGVPKLAAQSRNPQVMRMAIQANVDRGAKLELSPALVTATEQENERVLMMLLSSGEVRIEEEFKTRARLRGEELSLESMAEMLACLSE
ncbi:hypothetical protein F5Y16DRAFT_401335 [Xylariaceae sp. FL0255]|nr:hypothetical protein F5Y16DRAFT_401335 [Xylariaceae sp. FL0255]